MNNGTTITIILYMTMQRYMFILILCNARYKYLNIFNYTIYKYNE